MASLYFRACYAYHMRIPVTWYHSIEFACHSPACAPPPAGTGGSLPGYRAKNGAEYTFEQDGRSVNALRNGKLVGFINWEGEYKGYPELQHRAGMIHRVQVNKQHRRKGIATELYKRAKSIDPRVRHSTALTPDGKAWATARP